MKLQLKFIGSALLAFVHGSQAFVTPSSLSLSHHGSALEMAKGEAFLSRNEFFAKAMLGVTASAAIVSGSPSRADAVVYLDPAMYGDQELRVSAVDSLRESVRRAILQDSTLCPAFYQLALLDGLSYNAKSGKGGPDGTIVKTVLSSKEDTPEIAKLKKACGVLIESCKSLKKLSSITVADAVALAGAQAVESVGGPVLSVQLGRTDGSSKEPISPLPLNLLSSSNSSPQAVSAAFRDAGMTEREMVALLGLLLTLDLVEKSTPDGEDWKKSAKPQFRERGKMGRMSEFKRLTDEDIQDAVDSEFDDDEPLDDEPYIADTFGTRDQAFGKRVGGSDSKKDFNRFLKELQKGNSNSPEFKAKFGWIGLLFTDKQNPTIQQWVQKYSAGDLIYRKDLGVAYNAITQLGAEYTGGKYENLLKNKPRKSLNDD